MRLQVKWGNFLQNHEDENKGEKNVGSNPGPKLEKLGPKLF